MLSCIRLNNAMLLEPNDILHHEITFLHENVKNLVIYTYIRNCYCLSLSIKL